VSSVQNTQSLLSSLTLWSVLDIFCCFKATFTQINRRLEKTPNAKVHDLYCSTNIITLMQLTKIRCKGHVAPVERNKLEPNFITYLKLAEKETVIKF
jgi:hypothetical protein